MNKRIALLALSSLMLTGCFSKTKSLLPNKKTITVWVSEDCISFYESVIKDYQKEHAKYVIDFQGSDIGNTISQMKNNNSACGDIVTISAGNTQILASDALITPIFGSSLKNQIQEDNPELFVKASKAYLSDDTSQYFTFTVPYQSQALFLYYDNRYVTENEAQTFEGLRTAAQRYDAENGRERTKAVTVTGTDGYNFSFTLLARNLTNGNTSSLRLYENGERLDCYNQSNENVAVMKWAQRYSADDNGLYLYSSSSWTNDMKDHRALSFVGGSWHYNALKEAIGAENIGCALIPTFTLTSEAVEGIEDVYYPNDNGLPLELRGKFDPAPTAGTTFRGGSFTDFKGFVINSAKVDTNDEEKYEYVCDLLKFLSSKDVQKRAFKNNGAFVPTFKDADKYIESVKDELTYDQYSIGKAQTGMLQYGIHQPFINTIFNTNYYSRGTPDLYLNCVLQRNGAGSDVQSIRQILWGMEYIWKRSNAFTEYPSSLPYQTSEKYPA